MTDEGAGVVGHGQDTRRVASSGPPRPLPRYRSTVVTDHNTAFSVALVDALAHLGVRHACIAPGSRSTPLALALADEDRITDWSHHDERSSAFFALGIARTLGDPVVVVTTSGTAAAELYPAVIEARYGRVPLIALTADRPAELHDVGAPQTIDQRDLYGRVPLFTHDIDVRGVGATVWIGSLAGRLMATAIGPPPGPVHLNLRFREPLVPEEGGRPPALTRITRTRPGVLEPSAETVDDVATVASVARGLLVVGPQDSAGAVTAAAGFAAAAGWPIIADPLSGLRAGSHDLTSVIGHGDALAWEGWLDAAPPEAVIRFGAPPTSKPVGQWLAMNPEVPQVFIEPAGWRDPTGTAAEVVRADPAATLTAVSRAVTAGGAPDWMARWREADAAAAAAIDGALQGVAFPSEPAVARLLASALPDPSTLWVASSMPVRDIDSFFGVSERRIRLMGNRGANGIDGFISAGIGSAAVSDSPTLLLAGDLSLLHDLTALATAARLGIPVTIVVLNNDGGGIFHLLPQEGHRHFERHFGTPHGLDFSALAKPLGVDAVTIDDPGDLTTALLMAPTGPRVLEVHTDRAENAALHRDIRAAVRKAIEAI